MAQFTLKRLFKTITVSQHSSAIEM